MKRASNKKNWNAEKGKYKRNYYLTIYYKVKKGGNVNFQIETKQPQREEFSP